MSISKQANDILTNAEGGLRKLIAEAAQRGDYGSIERLASWASSIKEMIDGTSGAASKHPEASASRNGSAIRPASKSRKPKKRKGKSSSYPRFARSGENLVKVAWSKSQKSEYRHKSPRSVLLRLAGTLDQMMCEGAVISMDGVLPLAGEDGSEIPDYQAYLCLAWLRSIGAVTQKGREGYMLGEIAESLVEHAESAWSNLPEDAKR